MTERGRFTKNTQQTISCPGNTGEGPAPSHFIWKAAVWERYQVTSFPLHSDRDNIQNKLINRMPGRKEASGEFSGNKPDIQKTDGWWDLCFG